MVQSQFSLTWDSYKTSICNGFSTLQQNGEFVDMTLAADGHLVKVHQVLMALASPYLKELISSASCQHPIIFLNNVSHKVLGLLLEYIYTGEVLVPGECLSSFTETAKALHIKGLDNLMQTVENKETNMNMDTSKTDEGSSAHFIAGLRRLPVPATSGSAQLAVPVNARKITVRQDNGDTITAPDNIASHDYSVINQTSDGEDYTMMEDSGAQDDDFSINNNLLQPTTSKDVSGTPIPNFQFTVSQRGSLQVILNRYLYNFHCLTTRTNLRRWRCVNYRNSKCMAFIVTKDNVVVNRANLHNHPFHDKKILKKIEQKSVFSTLDDIQSYKDKEFGKNTNISDEEQIVEYEN